ncbi:MAG: hypothetical protein EHM58_09200 [Ignavibacteriae bacterium]|nr:MAG: hypothetical protein EHM58_09200 [Ignavibacteriota bacterium]
MYRAAAIIFIISFFPLEGFSQSPVSYTHDDSVTYKLYMTRSWDKLIEYEDKINESKQSYYTAFRLGAAYFESSKYMPAAGYFEFAANKNKTDELTSEYLYYSYLYSSRYSDARVLSSSFSKGLKKKIKYSKPAFFKGFSAEGGYYINSDYDELKAVNTSGTYNIFGDQTLIKNYYYANVSLSHLIGPRLSVFHGFSYFNYTITRQFTEKGNKIKEMNTDAQEKDYYISFNYNLGAGFGLNGGFHFLNTKGTAIDYEIKNVNNNLTYSYNYFDSNINEFALSLSIEKRLTYFKLLASSSISNLNQAKQFQGGLGITIFPRGNLNFYGYINAQYCSNAFDNGVNQEHFVVTPGLGFKVFDNLWLEAYYTFGGIFNYTENNAYIIYSNVNRITKKLNVKALIPVLFNKLDLTLNFEYYNINHTYWTYFNTTDFYLNINKSNNIKFIGGIKWSL